MQVFMEHDTLSAIQIVQRDIRRIKRPYKSINVGKLLIVEEDWAKDYGRRPLESISLLKILMIRALRNER